jgi:membrane dipeptidase
MIDPKAIHASALVIDTHADTPQRFLDEGWDFTSYLAGGHINLETARRGNLAAEFFAIWVEPSQHAGHFAARAFELADAALEQVRRHPDELQLCLSPADILDARANGKFGVLLGLEGGHSIENSLGLLRTFHRLGIRYMTLTWANNNEWADSSGDTPIHNGLTDFGRDVIREMNRLGMMVDVSHVSDKTFWDVLETSTAPVIASHSSARAITPSHRNLTDEQLKALAAKGGVALVNFYPAFIDETWQQAWKALRPERETAFEAATKPFRDAGQPVPFHISHEIDHVFTGRITRPPFASLIAHFDHMIQVAGVDHVGIGTDFDGIQELPEGIDSAADLPRITEALAAKGYTAEDLHKILGGNLMRVFAEIQAKGESSTYPLIS